MPFYDNSTSYQIEQLDYTISFIDGTIYNQSAGVYTWTNASQSDPIYVVNDSGNYVAYLSSLSVNIVNNNYDFFIVYITSRQGEAQVI